ncbi:gamma-glutamyltranspeptidase [Cadophora sp. DSE1049]|nr:gamma-glutamyltranspeptidase [Cadophora sp. DSE1049]
MSLLSALVITTLFIATNDAYIPRVPAFPNPGKSSSKQDSYGAVTCGNEICSSVGQEILRGGGNAADAAVAAQFCLGVISPDLTGLGGGGFALIRASNGSKIFVDFREPAPAASSQNMFTNHEELSLSGGLASGVPGELRGLEYIYDHFCTLPWKQLIDPAIKLARDGFLLYEGIATQIFYLDDSSFLLDDPQWSIDFAPNGTLLAINSTISRKRYAGLLESISETGPEIFYSGRIAEETIRSVKAAGGIMELEDLKRYKVAVRPTLDIEYRDYRLTSTSAPTSGPVALSALKIFEGYRDRGDPKKLNLSTHRLDEAIRFGYGERTKLRDPGFHSEINAYQHAMVESKTAKQIREKISDDHTLPVQDYNPDGIENLPTPGTSHLATADCHGLVVAMTSTINTAFGSRLVIPESGLVMNNQMNDFSIPGESNVYGFIPSPHNYIRPGERPQSSICPVIVQHLKTGGLYFVAGAAGGSRIITSVIQTLWHVLDQGMNGADAVAAPRLHDQLEPNVIQFELSYDIKTTSFLVSRGHNATWIDYRASNVNVLRLLSSGKFEAESDPGLVNGGSYTCC